MTESDIKNFLDEFRKAAISHGTTMDKGQIRAANKNMEYMQELYHELAIRGKEDALLNLLYDENQWVQVHAAIFMLEVDEETAIEKLKQIAIKGEPILSLDAQMAIKAWEDGFVQGMYAFSR